MGKRFTTAAKAAQFDAKRGADVRTTARPRPRPSVEARRAQEAGRASRAKRAPK